jgi:hypothetical protein
MMNCSTAQEILVHAGELLKCTAVFQTQYGRRFRLDHSSPREAWEQYENILQLQSNIASLLDPRAINDPFSRFGRWWENQSVMDVAIAKHLMEAVAQLIVYCGSSDCLDDSRIVINAQCTIAGMLDPQALKIREEQLRTA